MMYRKTIVFVFAYIFSLALYSEGFTTINGEVFHTTYHITYEGERDYSDSITVLFRQIDLSLSMFNDSSIIARMNRNDKQARANEHVKTVLTTARKVSDNTHGAFDITVGPLVNLWGFGYKNRREVTSSDVDSVRQFVGYKDIHLSAGGRLRKRDPRTIIDVSSIAKGYTCDVIGRWLNTKGINNYLIEIGGEIVVNGINAKKRPWGIAINTPEEDSLAINHTCQDILKLTDEAVATSGNYRNYYYENGRRYSHTIDPRTGYPANSDILSATVIARDCMTADAYATAFMVLGLQQSLAVLRRTPDVMAYFILAPDESTHKYRIEYSPSLLKLLSTEKH
ncbi:MAG: FAD:protein FMN transferase [Bacteroidaceae bacterium]|nr:FAD:protein FMN transferase [Bacteroidaceae bacterium]